MRVPLVFLLVSTGIAAGDGPPTIHVAPTVPPAFRLLADPAVQKDVGLNGAQTFAADRLRQALARPVRTVSLGRFGTIPADTFRELRTAQANEFLTVTLTKEQRGRLDQILFQLREKEFGPHLAFGMAARELRLRPDQVDDVRAIKRQRVEEIARAVTTGKRFERVKAEVEATNGDTFEKMAEMLTRAQRERLKELRGKAFDGKVDLSEGSIRWRAWYPKELFGRYDLELLYLAAPAVRAELKLSDAQITKLGGVSDDWRWEYYGNRQWLLRAIEQSHAMVEKALTDHLTADQRARFDQLMMQRRAKVSPEAACGYPAAVAALKLSPIQLKDLAEGKALADVLTRDQLDKYPRLFGPAFDLPHDLPRNSTDYFLPTVDRRLVPDVPYAFAREFLVRSDRLKLSAGQIQKLRELAEDEPKVRELIVRELSLDDTPPVVGPARYLTAVNAVAEQYAAAVEKQCWDVLDPRQQSIARKLLGRR